MDKREFHALSMIATMGGFVSDPDQHDGRSYEDMAEWAAKAAEALTAEWEKSQPKTHHMAGCDCAKCRPERPAISWEHLDDDRILKLASIRAASSVDSGMDPTTGYIYGFLHGYRKAEE